MVCFSVTWIVFHGKQGLGQRWQKHSKRKDAISNTSDQPAVRLTSRENDRWKTSRSSMSPHAVGASGWRSTDSNGKAGEFGVQQSLLKQKLHHASKEFFSIAVSARESVALSRCDLSAVTVSRVKSLRPWTRWPNVFDSSSQKAMAKTCVILNPSAGSVRELDSLARQIGELLEAEVSLRQRRGRRRDSPGRRCARAAK